MSGVFGIVARQPAERIRPQLDAMAAGMRHIAWAITEQCVVEGNQVALGRIGIGVFNREQQPVRNADGTLTMMMAGELYGLRDAPDFQRLVGVLDDEIVVLAAYERYGLDFVEHLDGAFVLVIWDRANQRVVIANDRCGLYPTYIANLGDRLLFAPEVKALLLDAKVSRELRDDAVAEYVRFQRLLGVKTFFAGVEQMLPASVVTFDLQTGSYCSRVYWDLGEAPALPPTIGLPEAVEEGGRLFRRAVEKMAQGPYRLGVFLSGGMDSRTILGFATEANRPVSSFTFGTPDSRDVYAAQRVARAAGAPNHLYTVNDGRWILDLVNDHVELTEGFQSWVHMHGMHMLPFVRDEADVNLSGLGDFVWLDAPFHPSSLVDATDDITFRSTLFEYYNQHYSWPGITEAEERTLYDTDYFRRVDGLAYASLVTELERYSHLSYYLRLAAFNLQNHFARHLLYHGVYGRSYFEYRFPYADLDLMSFCYALPTNVNNHNRSLQRAILARELPRLAKIPYAGDELPVTMDRRRDTMNRAMLKSRKAVNAVFPQVFPNRPSFHMDYETWLRTDLFTWAETVLLDERTLDRGIFREDALRSLLNRVRAANEPSVLGKVSHLITFELMLRQLCDAQPTF